MAINEQYRRNAATTPLRRLAEVRLATTEPEAQKALTEGAALSHPHELQVHQLELELQNAELLRVRDELEMALSNYTALYDFAPVGYFTMDADKIIRAVNLRGASLLGIDRSKLIGLRFENFVAKNFRHFFVRFFEKALFSRCKESCEMALLKEMGELYVQIEAVADASGGGCLVAVIDISERRQLEEKLEILHTDLAARAADLEAANVELEAFNYTVSHDLKRPLTIINGFSQILQDQCNDQLNELSKECIQTIYKSGQRMDRLITSLLKFSCVNRSIIQQEKIDLSVIVNTLALELKLATPGRRVSFMIADGVIAHGDANLLHIVIENLILNAWKYTAGREKTVIEFGVTGVAGEATYFVRDNGSGFDMRLAEIVFTPFQRLSGKEVEGHGIGLATVDRIIRRHGGRIWAESEPDKGATFFFTLPTAT